MDPSRTKNLGMTPWDLSQKEKEKRVMICSLKENYQANLNKQSKDYSDIGRTKEHALRSGITSPSLLFLSLSISLPPPPLSSYNLLILTLLDYI
ncbi:hypothetical protein BVC80_1271g13 [Macleaya cordata]|uniref:Uncharacterized protein n=1 Tax=Macleaya cordata TaxID=56857 RepID=A0A200Q002_MACCD|nr:hypothetical protein BVC80_1271g13 [Macleaya cordata]